MDYLVTLGIANVFLHAHISPGSTGRSVQVPHLAITILHFERHGLVALIVAHRVSVASSGVDHTLIRTYREGFEWWEW